MSAVKQAGRWLSRDVLRSECPDCRREHVIEFDADGRGVCNGDRLDTFELVAGALPGDGVSVHPNVVCHHAKCNGEMRLMAAARLVVI